MPANDTLEFLQCVLPAEGYYCAVVFDSPNPRPGVDFPRQQFCSTIEQLSEILLFHDAQGGTVYHACASFKTPTRRSHDNARVARSFWLDVDTGEGKAYRDTQEAAEAVVVFCHAVGLPGPLFVGSGNGIHCYWPLEADLDAQTWARYAMGLKSLCTEKGLKADPARTGDISSILRPPGTHHRKNGERLVRPGTFIPACSITRFAVFLDFRGYQSTARYRQNDSVVGKIFETTSYAAAYADPIADACGQLRDFKLSGNIREPHWYACLGVLSRCEDGLEKAHAWSANDYPAYSQVETQHKFERAKALTGATTCAKLNDINPGVCSLCPHWRQINSPITLGEKQTASIVPQIPSVNAGPSDGVPVLPVLPEGFKWSRTGQLCAVVEADAGGKDLLVITENPIYLDGVQTGEIDRTSFSYLFKKFLPQEGWLDVAINAGTLHGTSGIAELFGKGVVVHVPKSFLNYVRHAVDEYHDEAKTQTRYDQFGWKHDNTSFLFGKMLYTQVGPVEAIGAEEVNTRNQWLGPKRGGNLAAWTEAADSLFGSDMEGISTIVLASFAAPLMRFLSADEGGAILHAFTPSSGTGKTTALTGAWTVWGMKQGLNLTNEDTKVSKPIALGTLGNLPVIYDELRDKDPEVIRRLVLMFTEGRDRMRGTVRGTIRHTKASWQTILLSAANTSLIDQLQSDGPDAPAYRVLEISTTLPKDIDKIKGDRLKRVLSENAGHAGDAYLRYLMQPEVLSWTRQALEQWTREIWASTKLDTAHRFRVRLVGAIAVASAIVNKLDIIHFQTDRIVEWLLRQLDEERSTGTSSVISPLELSINAIGEFINEHYGEALVVPDRFRPRQPRMIPLLKPHNRLCIRYELSTQRVYIAETIFRDWAVRKQLSPKSLLQLLRQHRVVLAVKRNLTLSAGTDIPGAQVLCIECDAEHPVMSGLVTAVKELQSVN